jgi:hypothetical protein
MQEDVNNLKINIAVINNKLDNLEKKQDEILSVIKQHITDEEVNRETIMNTKADKSALKDLQDNQTWTVRTIIGLVIAAVIGIVITK